MTFRSIEFVGFFLAVVSLFYLVPPSKRKTFLLFASLAFIARANPSHLALFLVLRVVDFCVTRRMAKQSDCRLRLFFCLLSCAINLGALMGFKYLNFFSSILGIEIKGWDVVLPLGISFYTFHSLSYTLDVFNQTIAPESNFLTYLLYVSFFPQFIAGPIARANRLLPQFQVSEKFIPSHLLNGFYLIAKGFFMKLILSDALGNEVDSHFTGEHSQHPLLLLQTVYFYSFQVYLDFAGYSNIARGMGKCFKYELLENFNMPYFSESLSEFWKRWHMSLTGWLRDYVFYPLVLKVGGGSSWVLCSCLVFVFALSGLWHGANTTFVLWGLIHGFYLVIERSLSPTVFGWFFRTYIPRWLRCVLVFNLVTLASVFFRSSSVNGAWKILSQIGLGMRDLLSIEGLSKLNSELWILVLAFLLFEWLEDKYKIQKRFISAHWAVQAAAMALVTLVVELFAAPNPQTFVYLRF